LGKVFFAEAAIRDLLSQKGFLNSVVRAEVQRVMEGSRAIHFVIEPGGKTRIRKIDFTGNELFKDGKLKGQLKLTEERKWYWPWSKKNLYHPVKWDQDAVSVRNLYLNQGYLDVEMGAPIVEVQMNKKSQKKAAEAEAQAEAQAAQAATEFIDSETTLEDELGEMPTPKQIEKHAKKQAKAEKKARKKLKKEQEGGWVFLTVPITEGQQYTLGEITMTGNTVFPDASLRLQIPLREGQVLNNRLLEYGIERISNGYQDRGHLYSNVVRRIERRPGEQVADVTVQIDEDEPYYVGRIDFVGNTATQDRVLRRELLLLEGQLYSKSLLDLSKRKINQLGYWQSMGEPIIEPIEGENRVKITIQGQEQGRNEIQVGGGFSGVEGAFFNGVYSTRNFLGRGQIVSLALQIGGRSSRYQISFQEPWFFGKPYLFGVSLFRRDSDYGTTLNSTSSGFGIQLGKRIGRFSNLRLAYNYENVSSTTISQTITGETLEFDTTNRISSITPIYTFSTINNPYRPTRGKSLSVSVQVAGGPLGGDTSYIKPLLDFTTYMKAIGKSVFGFHAEAGFLTQFGNSSLVANSDIEGVPRYQRFWLGGDTLGPRVFETRTITPYRYLLCDADDNILDAVADPRGLSPDQFCGGSPLSALIQTGGNRMYLLQSELSLPMNEQIEFALFFDVGSTLFEDQSLFSLDPIRASAGVEMRFHLPVFPVPLRLIFGVPVREVSIPGTGLGDRTSTFAFSIGRSF
jgi:outer membrane protein insertion porin family